VHDREGHSRSSEVPLFNRGHPISDLVTTSLRDTVSKILPLFNVYVTACDLGNSFSFNKTVEVTDQVHYSIHI